VLYKYYGIRPFDDKSDIILFKLVFNVGDMYFGIIKPGPSILGVFNIIKPGLSAKRLIEKLVTSVLLAIGLFKYK
jgi:hypothetical protein